MRLELATLKQTEEKTIDDFIVRLKSKAALCAYASDDVKDEAITQQFIKGAIRPDAKKKLISKDNGLKLADAINAIQTYQASIQDTSAFNSAAAGQSTVI